MESQRQAISGKYTLLCKYKYTLHYTIPFFPLVKSRCSEAKVCTFARWWYFALHINSVGMNIHEHTCLTLNVEDRGIHVCCHCWRKAYSTFPSFWAHTSLHALPLCYRWECSHLWQWVMRFLAKLKKKSTISKYMIITSQVKEKK